MIEYQTVDLRATRLDQANRTIGRFPRRYRDAIATHPEVLDWTTRVIASPEDAPSLLMAGRTGVGKTYQGFGAMRAVLLALAERGEAIGTAWTTHSELNDRLRPSPDGSHRHALDEYRDAELLLLDDLAAGLASEWTADSLYRLVDGRWSNMLPTIFTSNMPSAKLEDMLGDRLMSRVAGMCTIVVLGGDDRRRTS